MPATTSSLDAVLMEAYPTSPRQQAAKNVLQRKKKKKKKKQDPVPSQVPR